MGQKVGQMALRGITAVSIVGCNVLRRGGEYKTIRRTSKNSQKGKKNYLELGYLKTLKMTERDFSTVWSKRK